MRGDNFDIVDRLARVETKLDLLLASNLHREERLAALEKWKSHITGWAASVAAIVGVVTSVLGTWLWK